MAIIKFVKMIENWDLIDNWGNYLRYLQSNGVTLITKLDFKTKSALTGLYHPGQEMRYFWEFISKR